MSIDQTYSEAINYIRILKSILNKFHETEDMIALLAKEVRSEHNYGSTIKITCTNEKLIGIIDNENVRIGYICDKGQYVHPDAALNKIKFSAFPPQLPELTKKEKSKGAPSWVNMHTQTGDLTVEEIFKASLYLKDIAIQLTTNLFSVYYEQLGKDIEEIKSSAVADLI